MNHSLQKEIDTNTLTDQQAAVDAVPLEEIDVSRLSFFKTMRGARGLRG